MLFPAYANVLDQYPNHLSLSILPLAISMLRRVSVDSSLDSATLSFGPFSQTVLSAAMATRHSWASCAPNAPSTPLALWSLRLSSWWPCLLVWL